MPFWLKPWLKRLGVHSVGRDPVCSKRRAMKSIVAVALAAVLAMLEPAHANEANPVQKVGYEIKTGKAQAAALKAAIAKQAATEDALVAKIEELSVSIATDEADLKAATFIREKEHADFVADENEASEVIDMLQRAIGILQREMSKHGASMLQLQRASSVAQALRVLVDAAALSSSDATQLTALVQSSDGSEDRDSGLGAPDPAVYKGHSDNIIETLQGVLDKATEQLDSARN